MTGPLASLAEPVRAVLDEVLSTVGAARVDWAAVVPVIAERAGLDLRSVDISLAYRRALDDVPHIDVVLRDHGEPDGDVELTITHRLLRPFAGRLPGREVTGV